MAHVESPHVEAQRSLGLLCLLPVFYSWLMGSYTLQIKWSVIRAYVSAGGWGLCVAAILCLCVFIAAQALTNIWLSAWSDDPPPTTADSLAFVNVRIGVYGALGISQGLSALLIKLSILPLLSYLKFKSSFELQYSILPYKSFEMVSFK